MSSRRESSITRDKTQHLQQFVYSLVVAIATFLLVSCDKLSSNNGIEKNHKIDTTNLHSRMSVTDTSNVRRVADFFYSENKYVEAASIYQSLIDFDSTKGEFYFKKGYCMLRTDKFEEAVELYKKSIALNHAIYASSYNIGLISDLMLSDTSTALIYYRMAWRMSPDSLVVKRRIDDILKRH